jgi:hypothetical protein
MNLLKQDRWPWEIDRVLISLEVVFFLGAFLLFGGMARLGAGTDSIGEWLSNFFVLRFMREDAKHAHNSEHAHSEADTCDPHDHVRERATENVALTFFGLAIATLLFHLLAGEQPPQENTSWIDWIAGAFTVSTGAIGVVKLKRSKWKKGSPILADAMQSLLCVLASFITILADYFHSSFEQSHTVGECLIVIMMFVAGAVILKTKKLCC